MTDNYIDGRIADHDASPASDGGICPDCQHICRDDYGLTIYGTGWHRICPMCGRVYDFTEDAASE